MSLFPSSIIHIKHSKELNGIKQKNSPILLCFSAEWCSPCRSMEGTLMNTAFELENKAIVVKADPKACEELVTQYGIRSIPAYVAIRNDGVSKPIYGVQSISTLLGLINA